METKILFRKKKKKETKLVLTLSSLTYLFVLFCQDLGCGKNCVPLPDMKVLSGAAYKEGSTSVAVEETTAAEAEAPLVLAAAMRFKG